MPKGSAVMRYQPLAVDFIQPAAIGCIAKGGLVLQRRKFANTGKPAKRSMDYSVWAERHRRHI